MMEWQDIESADRATAELLNPFLAQPRNELVEASVLRIITQHRRAIAEQSAKVADRIAFEQRVKRTTSSENSGVDVAGFVAVGIRGIAIGERYG